MEQQANAIRVPRWAESEEDNLARAYASYTGKNAIGYLLSISNRTKESIRGKIKSAQFREKVARFREEANVEAAAMTMAAPEEAPDEQVQLQTEDPIVQNLTAFIENTTDLADADFIGHICGQEADAEEWLDRWTQELIDKYGQTLKKNKRQPKINTNYLGRRKKRAAEYKLAQKEFKENRREYSQRLLEGKELTSHEETPDAQKIRQHYQSVFGSTPPSDEAPILDAKQEENTMYHPVTPKDIDMAIQLTKSDAAGPDGITKRRLKKIPKGKLNILFNAMFLLQHTPKALRDSKTILIPKTDDNLTEVTNWRPITVSSILLRTMNKIIAGRLSEVELDSRQRGFTRTDGCLANNITVQTIIKQKRREGRPYVVITLDLAKAFDSVSPDSITRALKRLRVDQRTIKYILSNYKNSTTNIQCEGNNICSMRVMKGVKQGDPMSPVLFNMVMDELLCNINKLPGIKFGQSNIACLAYADDLVIVASSIEDAKNLLNLCADFVNARGLSINTKKCTALATKIVPNKKKLAVVTEEIFSIGDSSIPVIDTSRFFKYLGLKFSYEGTKITTGTLHEQLTSIKKAPLKPQQKMTIIREHLIPRYISSMQHPAILKKTLTEVDRKIRNAIKDILHLPKHCHNAILYAPVKTGGLGIFCFTQRIPFILSRRVAKLQNLSQEMRDILNSSGGLLSRLQKITLPNINNTSDIHEMNTFALDHSFSGNGLKQMANHQGCNRWIINPPLIWTGEDYVKSIHLRFNLLPTMSLPYTPVDQRRCRAGCLKTESLSHVLQSCPLVHWKRIQRHNFVAKRIKDHAVRKGWKVTVEPSFRCEDGLLRKPDLLLQIIS